MENQDKIFEQIKDAAHKVESKEFPSFEKVWSRVEEKLDKKDDRKVIALWKKIAVAASLLLLLSIGYQFFKSDNGAPAVNPNNNIVTTEPKDTVKETTVNPVVESNNVPSEPSATTNPVIKKEADAILQKAVQRPPKVAVSDSAYFMVNKARFVTGFETPKADTPRIPVQNVAALNGIETVTGVVSDATGSLPGANVYVKGTNRGTQTNIDGKYTIDVKKGEQLVFSFVGMTDAVATVGSTKKIDMTLQGGTTLSEVVVQGYSSTKKMKTSVTRNTIKSETKQNDGYENYYSVGSGEAVYENDESTPEPSANAPAAVAFSNANVTQSIQGRVAGVNITTAGQPGVKTNIIVRGISSLQAMEKPLYVIDGVVSTEEDFRKLSADDIESVTFLKNAAATALYGSSAMNGAFEISSKKDEVVKPKSVDVSNEDYESFIENPFESPKNVPLSTFSIDVDNASYTNIRRFINNGETVPKDAVRVEEMVNFFKYKYPQPQDQHPFSINTEYSACPWNSNHKLLRVGLQGRNIPLEKLPASNLVFLIDVSGSMAESNKLPLLKQSMKVLINELREKDKVTIVVYAGAAGMVLPPTSGSDKTTIINALEKLNAGGSTAGGAGIELAYKMAQENFIKGGNNRVILATDGDFNVGMSANNDMEILIEDKRKSGVFLTCLGYGMGNYKDSKMEILADKGNGNYAYIDNIHEANRFLGKEFKGSMFAIAKDVKIQIEFNPKHVQSYRLIGYENRKLRPEDFTNDKIDAGELGSGHTVTALYEVIPTGVKSDYFNETPELKYTQAQATGNFNDELATIKFRYKKPDGDTSIEMVKVIENKSMPLENSSEDFKFSAAVAWFGLKLRDSKLIRNKASEDIKKLAQQGKPDDPEGYKAEFIRLVEAVK